MRACVRVKLGSPMFYELFIAGDQNYNQCLLGWHLHSCSSLQAGRRAAVRFRACCMLTGRTSSTVLAERTEAARARARQGGEKEAANATQNELRCSLREMRGSDATAAHGQSDLPNDRRTDERMDGRTGEWRGGRSAVSGPALTSRQPIGRGWGRVGSRDQG